MTPDAVQLLSCEADRLRSVAVDEGGVLPSIPTTIDASFAAAIAAVGAYAETMWELDLLRSLGYPVFNTTFDALRYFVDHPNVAALDTWGLSFAALFAGAADRRSVPAGCNVTSISFPGLSPADARILPQNLSDDPVIPDSGDSPMFLRNPVLVASVVGVLALTGIAAAIYFTH